MTRAKIVEELEAILRNISTANGYATDFERVESWRDVPTQYDRNYLIWRDGKEKYQKKNKYTATLKIEIIAVVLESANARADVLGTIALADLIKAVSQLKVCGSIVTLVEAHKWIETKGKTAAQVELNIDVKYQF
ncbi:MAG: hypothetical protein QNJ53_14690 [Pleurocapsa sp. MO_192.B19]|nr:hypothetical protein [Pleurocapsa sp. MO_192.B19]